jgi:hypothetical protein
MAKVFLSSTFTEMQLYRQAARDAIVNLRHDCVGMEDFPAEDYTAEQYCRERVRECEVFVLVLGLLYGSSPDKDGSGISYTEREFDAASEDPPKLRLVFRPGPSSQTNLAPAQQSLRAEHYDLNKQYDQQGAFLRRASQGRMAQPFNTPDELKNLIIRSLTDHFHKPDNSAVPQRPVGRMLPLICDRIPQTGDFGLKFDSAAPGCPEIYILHGRPEDQIANCVERLICRSILRIEKSIAPEADRRAVEFPTPSPSDPDEIVMSRFLCEILPQISKNYVMPRDPGPQHLCEAAAACGAPYIVLSHWMPIRNWTGEMEAFFAGPYLRLWDAVARTYSEKERWPTPPRFVIFFEFRHGAGEGGVFRAAVAKTLPRTAAPPSASLHLLPPLTDVDEPALATWLQNLGDRLLRPFAGQTIEQLFPNPPLPMREVESKLRIYLGMNS